MSELRDLALPKSGVTIQIKRIPVLLLADFWRNEQRLEPAPPMQKVKYGDEEREEPNPAHPDYEKALIAYSYEQGWRMIEFAVEFGVECEVDAAAVSKVRAWAEEAGMALPKSDKVVYVTRVLAQGSDVALIRDVVFSRVQPSEEEVRRKAESFQGALQGKKRVRLADPQVGGQS